MSTHLITLENVKKNYCLKTFDLKMNKGDFCLVSGSNGTGKTTLIYLVLGFIFPDCGMVVKQKLKINYCPEKSSLPTFIKVIDYIQTISKLKGVQINQTLIHALDIPMWMSMHQLSKGNYQKVALYQSLTGRPDLIILDEPLSGLDKKTTTEVIKVVKNMHELGQSFMISTHKPKRFERMANIHIKL